MWFNRGSGGSPVRLNRLPHGFTPASLRCLCAMDPEFLGKALQDCLRALGTGQGADPPAAPAPQAVAAPPAPHLADKFPLEQEVVVHNTCNSDTTLAPETPEWRWLADVTPKYVFRRAMTLWMKKHGQEDKDGVQSYPLETKCLSAGSFWSGRCCVWACRATPKATCPLMNQVWMPCSGYGPLRGAVLPGARPGLARILWAGAVVTAQDTVHASSSRRRWSCHQVASMNRRSSGTRRLQAACWVWAPPSEVGESTRRPRQALRWQQRRQRQWHLRQSCSQVWFKRSKGCNRCAVVQPSFQRVQPCG